MSGMDGRPIAQKRWYTYVPNPSQPYKTLEEAFENWRLLDKPKFDRNSEVEGGVFKVTGSYHDKWGQQDFLLQQLAPVLEDTRIHIKTEDEEECDWVIENHTFKRVD